MSETSHEPIVDPEFTSPVQRVVFSDVFGETPYGNTEPFSRERTPQRLEIPDFDAELYTAARTGAILPMQNYDVTAWPGVSRHGFVVGHDTRANVLPGEISNLETFRNWRGIENPTPLEAEMHVAKGGLAIFLANHNPRDKEHHERGVNGDRWHLGTTDAEGTAFIGQAQHFEFLARLGLLNHFSAVPTETTDQFYDSGEQFTSSFAAQFSALGTADVEVLYDASDPEKSQEGLEGYLSLDPLEHALLAYGDKFGNVQLLVHDIAGLVEQIQEGAEFRVKIDGEPLAATYNVGKTMEERRVVGTSDLKSLAHDGAWGLYPRPGAVIPKSGPGYVQLTAPLDDIRDWHQSALHGILTHLDRHNNRAFDPHDLDKVPIEIEAI